MRVLYWAELFLPYIGGVEVFSMQLITALRKRGHEFMVITSHDHIKLPDEEHQEGISIYRFPFQSVLTNHDLRVLKAVRQKIAALKESYKPDLVHINSIQPSVFFHQHTDSVCPAPTLLTVHSPIRTSERNSLLGRLLSSARWVATVSEAMLNDVRQLVPELKSRSNVIYNGLEAPEIEPSPQPFEEPRLLCIGRVVVDKGFDLAIDAFASIVKRFPRARLVIVGDGVARPELEVHVARLEMEGAVDFTGWVMPEKVWELINAATVVLMPSRWREPFGLVALQAAQMARPIVAARVGGIPEIVLHEETGLLVEKDDSAALAERIAFLLAHPDAATKMGQNARKRAQEFFNIERFANDYDALYRKLIEGSDG